MRRVRSFFSPSSVLCVNERWFGFLSARLFTLIEALGNECLSTLPDRHPGFERCTYSTVDVFCRARNVC